MKLAILFGTLTFAMMVVSVIMTPQAPAHFVAIRFLVWSCIPFLFGYYLRKS